MPSFNQMKIFYFELRICKKTRNLSGSSQFCQSKSCCKELMIPKRRKRAFYGMLVQRPVKKKTCTIAGMVVNIVLIPFFCLQKF